MGDFMKRLGKLFICIIILMLIMLFSLSVVAEEDVYGTYDNGIVVGKYSFQRINPLNKLTNGDFEQGLKYWATVNGERPSDVAKLLKEGNNTYIQLTGMEDFSGIVTPLFLCDKLTAGQMPVVIFDWRGSDEFQVFLSQWVDVGEGRREFRIGLKGGAVIKEAENESDWNTSITSLNQVLERSVDGNDNIYLHIGVQRFQNNTVISQIDNLRLGLVDTQTGKLTDYDGNEICMLENYRVKKLSKTQIKDGVVLEPEKSDVKKENSSNTTTDIKDKEPDSSTEEKTINTSEKIKIEMIILFAAMTVVLIVVLGVIYIKKLDNKQGK